MRTEIEPDDRPKNHPVVLSTLSRPVKLPLDPHVAQAHTPGTREHAALVEAIRRNFPEVYEVN